MLNIEDLGPNFYPIKPETKIVIAPKFIIFPLNILHR